MFPESFAYNREVMQTVNSCVPFGPFPSPPCSKRLACLPSRPGGEKWMASRLQGIGYHK